jgi:hypothetical protein
MDISSRSYRRLAAATMPYRRLGVQVLEVPTLSAACKTAISATELARLFSTVVRHHGMPERIISDRDPRFTALLARLLDEHGLDTDMGAAYHLEPDGQTENAKTSRSVLRGSVADFTCERLGRAPPSGGIPAFNNSKNETTGSRRLHGLRAGGAYAARLALAPLTKAADNPTAAGSNSTLARRCCSELPTTPHGSNVGRSCTRTVRDARCAFCRRRPSASIDGAPEADLERASGAEAHRAIHRDDRTG